MLRLANSQRCAPPGPPMSCELEDRDAQPISTPAVLPAPDQISDMRQARGAHACTGGPGNLLYVVG